MSVVICTPQGAGVKIGDGVQKGIRSPLADNAKLVADLPEKLQWSVK